jgi:hypothetical protein
MMHASPGFHGPALPSSVMPGLVPGIHANTNTREKTWMAGTSPAMTDGGAPARVPHPTDPRHRNQT